MRQLSNLYNLCSSNVRVGILILCGIVCSQHFALAYKPTNSLNDLRITGGTPANSGEYPWQVSIQQWDGSEYVHFCGGSIIVDQWILTAAHCLLGDGSSFKMSAKDGENAEIRVMAGEYDLSIQEPTEQSLNVVNVIPHESYNPSTMENDIALIQVDPAIVLGEYARVIALPAQDQQSSGMATITGWGATVEGGISTDILQEVDVPIISDANCNAMYEDVDLILPSMICAGAEGKGSCQGDSGGPMVVASSDDTQYQGGIVSWGKGCAGDGKPSVLTEVSYFVNWINDQIAAAL